MNTTQLPLARYRFRFKITKPFITPDYAGSMLRGVFGHALKAISCIEKKENCKHCSRYRECLYPAVFEAPPQQHQLQKFSQIPNPYVIEPNQKEQQCYQINDLFEFSMVLTGIALKQLPLIILAWKRAFERGLTKYDGKGILFDVALIDANNHQKIILNREEEIIKEHDTQLVLPKEKSLKALTLNFVTPLRIQRKSKPLKANNLTARDMLVTLARRVNLINEFHNHTIIIDDFSTLIAATEYVDMTPELYWYDWTRYSNRQKQKMTLGGVMGKITIRGDLAPFVPLLYMGQWLHLGKNATFGMGHYELELAS